MNQKIVDILLKLASNDMQFFDAEIRWENSIITGIDHEKSICQMMKTVEAILGFKYLTYKLV